MCDIEGEMIQEKMPNEELQTKTRINSSDKTIDTSYYFKPVQKRIRFDSVSNSLRRQIVHMRCIKLYAIRMYIQYSLER